MVPGTYATIPGQATLPDRLVPKACGPLTSHFYKADTCLRLDLVHYLPIRLPLTSTKLRIDLPLAASQYS